MSEERSYGGVFATIGDANEKDQQLNGMEVMLKDVMGDGFSGKIGVVYLTRVNRKAGIVEIWANFKEIGGALCLRPECIEVVSGPEHERLLAELLAELPFRSKAEDDALDAIVLQELADSWDLITEDMLEATDRELKLTKSEVTEAQCAMTLWQRLLSLFKAGSPTLDSERRCLQCRRILAKGQFDFCSDECKEARES